MGDAANAAYDKEEVSDTFDELDDVDDEDIQEGYDPG